MAVFERGGSHPSRVAATESSRNNATWTLNSGLLLLFLLFPRRLHARTTSVMCTRASSLSFFLSLSRSLSLSRWSNRDDDVDPTSFTKLSLPLPACLLACLPTYLRGRSSSPSKSREPNERWHRQHHALGEYKTTRSIALLAFPLVRINFPPTFFFSLSLRFFSVPFFTLDFLRRFVYFPPYIYIHCLLLRVSGLSASRFRIIFHPDI